MRPRLQIWNVACATLALFVFASTFQHGRWGTHWAFLTAYGITAVYCAWRRIWIAFACTAALLWLRLDLALGSSGYNLRVASTLFAVLYFMLCMRKAGDMPTFHWPHEDVRPPTKTEIREAFRDPAE
jgi:hypothetical protein